MSQNESAVVRRVETEPMPIEAIQQQVGHIHRLLKSVMQKDQHYGVIPGTSGKPTLLKAGAEKLCLMFRLAPTYDVQRNDLPNGHREFDVVCTLTNMASGVVVGQGVGSCSTMESKYRWRKGERVCPDCQAPAIIKGKAQYGGGWLCWAKKGGCGAKFQDGDQRIESQNTDRVENTDIADAYNTVLKMAKKRAHVDAAITATSASDIFTQDIGDAEAETDDEKPTTQKPPAAADDLPPLNADGGSVLTTIIRVSQQAVANGRTRYGIETEYGWFGTFSDTLGGIAQDAAQNGTRVTINYYSKKLTGGKLVFNADEIVVQTGDDDVSNDDIDAALGPAADISDDQADMFAGKPQAHL